MSIWDAALVNFMLFSIFLSPNTPSIFQEFNSEPWFVKVTLKLKMIGLRCYLYIKRNACCCKRYKLTNLNK